jgi:hypothetical protein
MSKRKAIREALKTILLNNTDCNANVYSNRVDAYWEDQLPAISIMMNQESSLKRDIRATQYLRTLELSVVITNQVAKSEPEPIDDFLDKVAEQVEGLIIANPSLNGEVSSTELTSTEIELSGEANKPLGVLTLNYEIKYMK